MKKRALARFFSHGSPALVRGAAALRFGHGQGSHVDEAAHGGAGREHMHRRGRAQQDGADGDAVAVGGFEHVEEDVGCVQAGADEQVGLAAQGAVGHAAGAQLGRERGVAVHFAVAFHIGHLLAEQVARGAHLQRRGARG